MGARRVGGPEGCGPDLEKVSAPRVGVRRVGPKGRAPQRGGSKCGGPKAGGPKICAFFSLSRPHFRSFSLSLGVFSWNFGGV